MTNLDQRAVGWYRVAGDDLTERYWDGQLWSRETRPVRPDSDAMTLATTQPKHAVTADDLRTDDPGTSAGGVLLTLVGVAALGASTVLRWASMQAPEGLPGASASDIDSVSLNAFDSTLPWPVLGAPWPRDLGDMNDLVSGGSTGGLMVGWGWFFVALCAVALLGLFQAASGSGAAGSATVRTVGAVALGLAGWAIYEIRSTFSFFNDLVSFGLAGSQWEDFQFLHIGPGPWVAVAGAAAMLIGGVLLPRS